MSNPIWQSICFELASNSSEIRWRSDWGHVFAFAPRTLAYRQAEKARSTNLHINSSTEAICDWLVLKIFLKCFLAQFTQSVFHMSRTFEKTPFCWLKGCGMLLSYESANTGVILRTIQSCPNTFQPRPAHFIGHRYGRRGSNLKHPPCYLEPVVWNETNC